MILISCGVKYMKILDYALMQQPDTNLEAWRNSRPNEDEKDISYNKIASLDLPVNEFDSVFLFIESTIIEREIFTSLRNHIMWAQTSRVQNVLEFEIEQSLENWPIFEHKRNLMIEASKIERQDEFRMNLPVLSNTRYSISTNPRQLIHLFNNFIYLADRSDHVMDGILRNSAGFIGDFLRRIGYGDEIISSYKTKPILNELMVKIEGKDSGSSNFINIDFNIPFSLRAQLVRHREIIFIDSLYTLITANNNIITGADLNSNIACSISGSRESIENLFSKRACWIAHYKLWKPVLDKLGDKISLPCNGGKCPYNADAHLRYEDKDPNPPCPIHLKLNNLKPTQKQKTDMKNMTFDDERPLFWSKAIMNLETK